MRGAGRTHLPPDRAAQVQADETGRVRVERSAWELLHQREKRASSRRPSFWPCPIVHVLRLQAVARRPLSGSRYYAHLRRTLPSVLHRTATSALPAGTHANLCGFWPAHRGLAQEGLDFGTWLGSHVAAHPPVTARMSPIACAFVAGGSCCSHHWRSAGHRLRHRRVSVVLGGILGLLLSVCGVLVCGRAKPA